MAIENGTESFKSGLVLEEAFIELKALVQSYVDLAGEEIPPMIYTLGRALDRFDAVLKAHQGVLHGGLK